MKFDFINNFSAPSLPLCIRLLKGVLPGAANIFYKMLSLLSYCILSTVTARVSTDDISSKLAILETWQCNSRLVLELSHPHIWYSLHLTTSSQQKLWYFITEVLYHPWVIVLMTNHVCWKLTEVFFQGWFTENICFYMMNNMIISPYTTFVLLLWLLCIINIHSYNTYTTLIFLQLCQEKMNEVQNRNKYFLI